MPGGPLNPYSLAIISNRNSIPFAPFNFDRDGANDHRDKTHMAVKADLESPDIDAVVHLSFEMPNVLPSGTAKLRIVALCDVSTGTMAIRIKWASVAVGEDPSAATLIDEGNQSISWASGDNDKYLELKIDLDADTVVAGEIVVMEFKIVESFGNVADLSCYTMTIIWE